MRMPFGRHKGQELSEVPWDYLEWLESIDLRPHLRAEVEAEKRRRREQSDSWWANWRQRERSKWQQTQQQQQQTQAGPAADVEAAISRWYSEMARKYHPDRGGSHEQMMAINDAADRLRRILKGQT